MMEIKKLYALFFFMIFIVLVNGEDTNKDDWRDYGSFHYDCDCSCDSCPICPNSPVSVIPKIIKISNSSGCWCWCDCPPCPPPQQSPPPTEGRHPPPTPPKKSPHSPSPSPPSPMKNPHSPSPTPPMKNPHSPSPTPPKKNLHSPSPKPKCAHLHVIKEFIKLTIKNLVSATNDIKSLPPYYKDSPIGETLSLCGMRIDQSYAILTVTKDTTQFINSGLSFTLETQMKKVMAFLGDCSDALTQYVKSINYTPLDGSTVDMLNKDLKTIYNKVSDLERLIPSLDKCS